MTDYRLRPRAGYDRTRDDWAFDKLGRLIEFADAYASLGDAITSQVRALVASDGREQPTAGAIEYILARLVQPLSNLAGDLRDEEFEEEVEDFKAALADENDPIEDDEEDDGAEFLAGCPCPDCAARRAR